MVSTCPLCGKALSGYRGMFSHMQRHLAELEARGLVQAQRLPDGTWYYVYRGRVFLGLRDLLEAVAGDGAGERG